MSGSSTDGRGRATRCRCSAVGIVVAAVLMLAPAAASASSATGDGSFGVSELTTSPEPNDAAPLTTLFSGVDALGFPWFPNGTPASCVLSANSGIDLLITGGGTRPCGSPGSDLTNNNGQADYVVVDGFILLPADAEQVTLRATNVSIAGGRPPANALYFFASDLDDRATMSLVGGDGASSRIRINVDWLVDLSTNPTDCARYPAISYRLYVFDGHSGGRGALRWKVDGGSADSAGTFVNVPALWSSSVDGYDNDLDDDGMADYLTQDTDADGVPDWDEFGGDPMTSGLDSELDGVPDCEDSDADNDGSADGEDPNPLTPTAAPDTVSVVAGDPVSFDVTGNDLEFAGLGNQVTDIGTGTASGHSLAPNGDLSWDTTNVAPGAYTVVYEICNEAEAVPGCATETASVVVLLRVAVEPDTSTANPPGSEVSLDVVANDPAVDIDRSTLALVGATEADGSLVVDGEGTWSVSANGIITFTPEADFVGNTTPVFYTVADTAGTTSAPTEVSVGYAPLGPTAAPTTSTSTMSTSHTPTSSTTDPTAQQQPMVDDLAATGAESAVLVVLGLVLLVCGGVALRFAQSIEAATSSGAATHTSPSAPESR